MTQEQEHFGGKNDKRTKNNPSLSHYMLNPMLYAIKAIYYGINMKIGKKAEKGHSPIDQAPLIIKQKINNQWRDKIKQLMTFYSRTKKLKKLHYGDLNEIVLKIP